MLALVFAITLKDVLDIVIDESHSGFMMKLHITNNIVLDLLDYNDLANNSNFILFVEHGFILKALAKFGFVFFCKTVRTL